MDPVTEEVDHTNTPSPALIKSKQSEMFKSVWGRSQIVSMFSKKKESSLVS